MTGPGSPDWADHLRVAVRDPATSRAFAGTPAGILDAVRAPEEIR